MTVAEVERRMSAKEVREWQVFFTMQSEAMDQSRKGNSAEEMFQMMAGESG